MNYFNYQKNYMQSYELFSGMDETLERLSNHKNNRTISSYNKMCDYGHTLELMNSVANGHTKDPEFFNLGAYEYRCEENDKFSEWDKVDKEVAIVDDPLLTGESSKTPYGTVSESKLKSNSESELRLIEDVLEYESTLIRFKDLNREYRVKGIDLDKTFKNALKYIPEALESLKQLVKQDSRLEEMVYILCSNSTN